MNILTSVHQNCYRTKIVNPECAGLTIYLLTKIWNVWESVAIESESI